jgi:hypothetical protein
MPDEWVPAFAGMADFMCQSKAQSANLGAMIRGHNTQLSTADPVAPATGSPLDAKICERRLATRHLAGT